MKTIIEQLNEINRVRTHNLRNPLAHADAWEGIGVYPSGFEVGLLNMLRGAAQWCDAYRERFPTDKGEHNPLGDDGMAGPALSNILDALHDLLNFDRGRLDGGLMSRSIIAIGKAAKLEDYENE